MRRNPFLRAAAISQPGLEVGWGENLLTLGELGGIG